MKLSLKIAKMICESLYGGLGNLPGAGEGEKGARIVTFIAETLNRPNGFEEEERRPLREHNSGRLLMPNKNEQIELEQPRRMNSYERTVKQERKVAQVDARFVPKQEVGPQLLRPTD